LRYGTVPVVRATGGLDDTIDSETGYKFTSYTVEAFTQAVRDALAGYRNRKVWQVMMKIGMARDFSWDSSAREYDRLYHRLLNPQAV